MFGHQGEALAELALGAGKLLCGVWAVKSLGTIGQGRR